MLVRNCQGSNPRKRNPAPSLNTKMKMPKTKTIALRPQRRMPHSMRRSVKISQPRRRGMAGRSALAFRRKRDVTALEHEALALRSMGPVQVRLDVGRRFPGRVHVERPCDGISPVLGGGDARGD